METTRFEEMNLDERIIRAVTEMGFEEASPIQAQAIPIQLEGHDIIGQAQTGTGKTAAFGIPLLQKVDIKSKKLQVVVLCPTRELAIQSAEELRKLAKFMHGLKVLPIYGGQDIVKQIRSLKDGTQVIVGTPGRVMDHMRRKTVKFDEVHTMILDEADEMLNMGFLEDIETILAQLPDDRQTVMFSATMPQAISSIAKRFQNEPVTVKVTKKELTVPKVTQYYYEVKQRTKIEVLCRLLDMYAPTRSIIFCNTKRMVDELVSELTGRGYFADALHGDLKQSQRDNVMSRFRKGKTDMLIATDVAARGIDVDDVEAVFNYDIPQDEEYYVHRIGRTGRAGKEGKAFSFVVGKDVYKLRDIQRYCNTKIIAQPIPSLNDVTAIKVDKLFDQIIETIEENDLSKLVGILETKLNEEEYTSLDLAAALLKMQMGDGSDVIIDSNATLRDLDNLDEAGRGGSGRRDGSGSGRRKPSAGYKGSDKSRVEDGMQRLFINIGKKQGIRPGDIVGAIAGESNISGKVIGSIDMFDSYTFVDVPVSVANGVIKAMDNAKIRGKNVHVEMKNDK